MLSVRVRLVSFFIDMELKVRATVPVDKDNGIAVRFDREVIGQPGFYAGRVEVQDRTGYIQDILFLIIVGKLVSSRITGPADLLQVIEELVGKSVFREVDIVIKVEFQPYIPARKAIELCGTHHRFIRSRQLASQRLSIDCASVVSNENEVDGNPLLEGHGLSGL